MTKIVPSQIVSFIDGFYPKVKSDPGMQVYSADSAVLGAIIDLADDLPVELLTISGEDYTNYVFGLEAMQAAIDRWNHHGTDTPPRTHKSKSPVYLVREALLKCPDQNPSPQAASLPFLSDPQLAESIRLDIDSATNALHRNDFKAATVLSGSAMEALLLWKLRDVGLASPISGMRTNIKKQSSPEEWVLEDYITAAEIKGLIKPDTVAQARLAQNYRNLIHPGRAVRLAQTCNRGTAFGALAAVHLVVADFT
ncbi:hypothetical protein GGD66_005679 [Bradyrhizobium sp. CIR48]|uniref:hypothetical protein n=1 Tax=Bradyrhizobium sp. CIR48 TaxID=2663840 RepID=UPI001605F89B|nr:hypothetical protein [Bradyrhizobium sp. CIR48]MBB4427103.1 hypothetical protein [Bradyrhizobium sp. CIR48]